MKYLFVFLIFFNFKASATASFEIESVEQRIQDLEAELQHLKSTNENKDEFSLANDGPMEIKNAENIIEDESSSEPVSSDLKTHSLQPVTAEKKPQNNDESTKKDSFNIKSTSDKNIKDLPLKASSNDDSYKRAQELYEQAQLMIGQKKLKEAQQILEEIVKAYSDSPFYLKSQYWLAEISFENLDYMNASLAYGALYQYYKNNTVNDDFKDRIVEALIKFSYCLNKLKKPAEACVIMNEYNKEFKNCSSNVKMFAAKVNSALKCGVR